ncbi:MFS transporter [Nitratireductor thuwali]|uniref:Major facilitator superfamily (MFS) profile domain-containing protein n=1 Tax=Nitratireductor thuwali TaxID=2267699 RepID=A0ABY5MQT9_9HYPH|nr:hypothetical protein NTH_04193 [Nitratireductor thuwali]
MSQPSSSTVEIVFAPLRVPAFRNLWVATVLAGMGAWAQAVGAAWLMLELVNRADLVAYVQAANSAPVLLLSFLAGALADTCERRSLQLRAQVWVLFGATIFVVICASGLADPMLVLLLTFVVGVGTALRAPAWQASIRDLVSNEQVPAAVTLSSVGFNFSRIAGPAIGGLVVAIYAPMGAFIFNMLASLALIFVLLRMPKDLPKRANPSFTKLVGDLRSGASYVLSSRLMCIVLIRAAAVGIPSSAILALLPVLTNQRFSGTSMEYGLLLGFFGLGAMVSAFALAHWRKNRHPESLLSGASLALALSLFLLAQAEILPLAAAAVALGGFAWVVMLTTLNTAVQLNASNAFRGRALSAYMTCAFGGLMIGSLLWGSLAQHAGVRTAFLSAAAVLAGTLFLRLGASLPRNSDRFDASERQ